MIPEVSILLLAGTSRPFLRAAIESLRDQEGVSWEAVVVEACEDRDASMRIQQGFAEIADPRFRLIRFPGPYGRPPHLGRRWNFGLAHAQAPLIAFLDDDDRKQAGWLAAMAAAFTSTASLATAISRACVIDQEGKERGYSYPEPPLLTQAALLGCRFITLAQLMTRSAILRALGGFDETLGWAEDFDLCLRLADFPWVHVASAIAEKREGAGVENISDYQIDPEVHRFSQQALWRIVEKYDLARHCAGCQRSRNGHRLFVDMTPQGLRLWHRRCAARAGVATWGVV